MSEKSSLSDRLRALVVANCEAVETLSRAALEVDGAEIEATVTDIRERIARALFDCEIPLSQTPSWENRLLMADAVIAQLPKALISLEDAYREIKRLEKMVLDGDDGYRCALCDRVFDALDIDFTVFEDAHCCYPCVPLARATR